MKIGLVDVGGGLRGIYASGILDYCLDKGISFDLCIGVSAGSANIVSYLAGQRGRNYKFYTDYSKRWEYMSIKNYIHTGSYINMDYVYKTLSGPNGENPFDFDAFNNNKTEFVAVASNALTGKPAYFTKNDISLGDYGALAASCSIPGVNSPYIIKDIPYYDGGVTDPIPFLKAFELGCDRVIVILTKPSEVPLKESHIERAIGLALKREYPNIASCLQKRIDTYNSSLELAKKYESEGRILIVSPTSIDGVSTLIRRGDSLDSLYKRGYEDGARLGEFLGRAFK